MDCVMMLVLHWLFLITCRILGTALLSISGDKFLYHFWNYYLHAQGRKH